MVKTMIHEDNEDAKKLIAKKEIDRMIHRNKMISRVVEDEKRINRAKIKKHKNS